MGLPFTVRLDETFTAEIRQLGSVIDADTLSTGENRRTFLFYCIFEIN
jgi:hypothetical protein